MATVVRATAQYEVSVAVATATPKDPDANQDRASTVLVPDGAASVLCDGVGSYEESGDVAERCLSLACGHIGIEGVGAGVTSCADAAADAMSTSEDLPEGATTLVAVGGATDGTAYFSSVGNGSVFVLEPLSVKEGHAHLMVAELTLPHCEIVGSQPALRSFLPAPRIPIETTSGVLLPRSGRSRLLLACSDGVTTGEETAAIGLDGDGRRWKPILDPFAEMLEMLQEKWVELLATSDQSATLADSVQACLDSMGKRGLLEDDATVAAVLMRPDADDAVDEDGPAS
jgi:hypothetical protein